MFDLLMLALLAAMFVGVVAYVHACGRLVEPLNHPPEQSP